MFPLLQQRWKVYGINYRGHGKSSRTPGEYRFKDYAKDIVAFIDHLDEKPLLFGHSLGGIIEVGVAAERSDALLGIIMGDPPITNESTLAWLGQSEVKDWCQSMVKVIKEGGSIWEIAAKLDVDPINPINLSRARTIKTLDHGVFEAWYDIEDSLSGYDMNSLLKEIKCPTLLIQADDEGMGKAMTDEDVEYALSVMPQVSLYKVNGLSHGLGVDGGNFDNQVKEAVMTFSESLR
jgi:pimeloyl-ACP methyl ester carboxylesterase